MQRIPVWPALSPDLNVIEMLWDNLDGRIRGEHYDDDKRLFADLELLWNWITPHEIMALTSSFRARCEVVIRIGGESLNGHWNEVHALHHPLAT
jgi:hypothetical protein